MSWIFKNGPSATPDPKALQRRALFLSVPFALMGLFALVLLLHDGFGGGLSKQKAIQLCSVIVVAVGFPILIFGITAKKNALNAAKLKSPGSADSEKLRQQQEHWATGRIQSSGPADVKISLFMGFAFCAIGGLIAFLVIPKKVTLENYPALLALIFPMAGLAFLMAIVRKIIAHRHHGDCFFTLTSAPGIPGGTLDGKIQTTASLKPERGFQLRLFCIRRTGVGRNRAEKILWQEERIARIEPGADPRAIPVHFELPSGQPESSESDTETILWRLEVKAKVAGPVFDMKFDVPVFRASTSI